MEQKPHNIYPDKVGYLDRINKRLAESPISERNQQLIRAYQNYLFSTGTGEKRVSKLTLQLITSCLFEEEEKKVISINLDEATKNDILNLISFVNRHKRYSEATKSDYRRCIKQLYRWYQEEDMRLENDSKPIRDIAQKLYRYLEKEVSISYKKKQIDPSTILTEEDITLVVSKGCRTPKEKALIKFLHETGLRAGELLQMRIRDIEIKKNIGVASVDGKTGRRTVQFANSMAYIIQWLNVHPGQESPDTFLWLGESSNNLFEPLKHRGVHKLVNRCFEKAGVDKKHNLHWFRHSRASLLAPHLPESLLCKYMGWSIGSKQVKTYLHLCPQQLEDAFLKMNGLAKDESRKDLPQQCGCGVSNDSTARYCLRCGNPLRVDVALQDQEMVKSETGKAVKEMMQMFQNPEMLKAFMEFKARK